MSVLSSSCSSKVIFSKLSPVVWALLVKFSSILKLFFCPFLATSGLCGFVLYFSIVMLENLIMIAEIAI